MKLLETDWRNRINSPSGPEFNGYRVYEVISQDRSREMIGIFVDDSYPDEVVISYCGEELKFTPPTLTEGEEKRQIMPDPVLARAFGEHGLDRSVNKDIIVSNVFCFEDKETGKIAFYTIAFTSTATEEEKSLLCNRLGEFHTFEELASQN